MRVAVLGAGLQGACVSMELASAGIDVDLYDKNERSVTQASAHNEGKIHLGFVYANDRTLNTVRMLVRGASTFSPLMRRWIGDDIEKVPVSAPFHYAAHKDSLISVEELERHLSAVHTIAREESSDGPVDYFGNDYQEAPTRLAEYDSLFNPARIVAAFKTPEIGIDAEALASCVRDRMASEPRIRCVMRATVLDVDLTPTGGNVDFEMSGDRFRQGYDHVVNTLWDGRLTIDSAVGIRPHRPWLFRIKHYLRISASSFARFVPSATIVLGPFGDVVTYANGDLYLSWYPAGMRGMSGDLCPPDWPRILDEQSATLVRQSILSGLVSVVPALAGLAPGSMDSCQVKGGIIFAWGSTDIDDPASDHHARHEIGPRSFGRYHSIDTGKLTMAPLFAKMVADRIRAA